MHASALCPGLQCQNAKWPWLSPLEPSRYAASFVPGLYAGDHSHVVKYSFQGTVGDACCRLQHMLLLHLLAVATDLSGLLQRPVSTESMEQPGRNACMHRVAWLRPNRPCMQRWGLGSRLNKKAASVHLQATLQIVTTYYLSNKGERPGRALQAGLYDLALSHRWQYHLRTPLCEYHADQVFWRHEHATPAAAVPALLQPECPARLCLDAAAREQACRC